MIGRYNNKRIENCKRYWYEGDVPYREHVQFKTTEFLDYPTNFTCMESAMSTKVGSVTVRTSSS